MINTFMNTFITYFDNGLDEMIKVALIIASLFACIDFIYTIGVEYANDFSQIFSKMFRKFLNYGIIFVLIRNYKLFVNKIILLTFEVGYFFYPNPPAVKSQYPDFNGIYKTLAADVLKFELQRKKLWGWQIATGLVYIVLIVIGFACIFYIIKEIIVAYIEFKFIATLGIVLIPFLATDVTKSIGSRVWGAMLIAGARVMVAVSLVGIALQGMKDNPYNPPEGSLNLADAMGWLFMLCLVTYLVTKSKELGGMLANGTAGGRVSSGVVGAAIGAVAAVATGGAGAVAVKGAAISGAVSKGVAAAKSGKNLRGIANAMKEGAKDGASAMKNSRLGKIARKIGGGIRNTVDYATGRRGVSNVFSDTYNATVGTVGEQVMHDSNDSRIAFSSLGIDTVGKVSDYMTKADKQEINRLINNEAFQAYDGVIKDGGTKEEAQSAMNSVYKSKAIRAKATSEVMKQVESRMRANRDNIERMKRNIKLNVDKDYQDLSDENQDDMNNGKDDENA